MSIVMRIMATIFCISGGLALVFGVISIRTHRVDVEDITSLLFDISMVVFYIASAGFMLGLFWG